MRSQSGGPVERVVVAAGGENGAYISTTEIYDMATDSWSKGTPLPVALGYSAVVPFETTGAPNICPLASSKSRPKSSLFEPRFRSSSNLRNTATIGL